MPPSVAPSNEPNRREVAGWSWLQFVVNPSRMELRHNRIMLFTNQNQARARYPSLGTGQLEPKRRLDVNSAQVPF